MRLISLLLGEWEILVEKDHVSAAINLLGTLDVPFGTLARDGAGDLHVTVPSYRIRRLERAFREKEIPLQRLRLRGVPDIFRRYRRRWGIAVGAFLFFFLIVLSHGRIWCVEVFGNDRVEDQIIVDLLADLGCGVGDRVASIDFDILHNEFLLRCSDISWISVNMNGTHAHVEVRESLKAPDEAPNAGYYNIVAAEDGQIEQMAAFEGAPQVEIGDAVRKGELLISGIASYGEGGVSFENAAGEVFAKVNREFLVEVPLATEEKRATGESITRKTLIFFQFQANLFRNSGIPYDFYDTIDSDEQILLFDRIALPLWVRTQRYDAYALQPVTLTEEAAKVIAYREYRGLLQRSLSDAELLQKTVDAGLSEDGVYRIHCKLYCLANIAQRQPLLLENENDAP